MPFCPGHALEELQESRGRKVTDTIYDPTFGHDIPLAIETIKKLQDFDSDERVFTIIAHDSTIEEKVDHFPAALNQWTAKGWGDECRWAFLHDFEDWWKLKGVR